MTTLMEAPVSRETEGQLNGEEPLFDAPTPGTKTEDPDAPYGFTSTGAPRKAPGRKPGQRPGTGKAAAKTIPAPPKKAIPTASKGPKKTQVDYRPALLKLGGEFIGTAAIWGLMKDNVTTLADTAAVATAFPAIVDTVNTAADKWPLVAAILDRVLPMAEFAKSGGVIVLMAAQIAVNHRMLPPGLVPGTHTPETLVGNFLQAQMAENPEFAATIAAVQQMKGAAAPQPAPAETP